MRIVLLGFGTVGQALARMLREQRETLAARLGTPPRLVAVTDSRGSAIDPHGLNEAALLAAKAEGRGLASLPGIGGSASSLRVVLSTPADVVVETTPSNLAMPRPALDHLLGAMRTGKHVVSVNKAPLAVAMPALLEAARHNRIGLAYSGTVGAATPFLHAAGRLAVGDRIVKVRAILNGTTNFILHRMFETDEPFNAALAEAVRLGYAETDPSNDIDGIDTAMKLVIMANHAARSSGRPAGVAYRDVRVGGIRGLAIQRVREAKAAGKAIKLIATIDEAGVRVGPEEVDVTSPLNTPRNVNACTFSMAQAGEVTLVGRGAGGAETATAIVRDIIEVTTGARVS
ncbi:MAG: homoserine dehydrogenase [Phycisphaerales bacterium]|nr:homoserine dehydrogenase [Phycisphaerales bacterium]